MKKYNILVTAVGAIIGYGIIRALRRSRYDVNVIGMDINDDAAGRKWCDHFVKSVPASDERYPDFLAKVMRECDIDLVFLGIEQEIYRLIAERERFKGDFRRLVLNNEELVELSRDKWRQHEFLLKNGFPVIPSLIEGGFREAVRVLGEPFLLKPRQSTASKGICEIDSREDYDYWKRKMGRNFMVQQIVGDDDHEYTVGAFGLGDGTFSQAITFSRKLSRDGSTVKAKRVEIGDLNRQVEELCSRLKPVGPTNFQFRLHEGRFLLLEVNPRFSSSLSLRTAFGFNEPEMSIEFFAENRIPAQSILAEGSAVRYIEDIVTYL